MKNIDLEYLKKINVGGGEIYILNYRDSEDIIANGATVNYESSEYIKVLGGKWGKVKGDAAIKMAIHNTAYTRNKWLGLFVVYYEGSYRRVDFIDGCCDSCQWSGLVATPLSFSLYNGTMDEVLKFIEEARKLTPLKCPICNGKINGHPIWIENNKA